jgi:hypothetical protein
MELDRAGRLGPLRRRQWDHPGPRRQEISTAQLDHRLAGDREDEQAGGRGGESRPQRLAARVLDRRSGPIRDPSPPRLGPALHTPAVRVSGFGLAIESTEGRVAVGAGIDTGVGVGEGGAGGAIGGPINGNAAALSGTSASTEAAAA